MIVPNRDNIKERVRVGSEVFHSLKKILNEKGYNTAVGDEGGFAPNLTNNIEALDLIVKAIEAANYVPGQDVNLALDIAASSFYDKDKKKYVLRADQKELTSEEMINYYEMLIDKYPIISIEDHLMKMIGMDLY